MAIKFTNTEGKAKKNASYAFKDGENVIRIFGDVLPRYVYWVKTKDGKDIPLECLSFDRDQEKFTNVEKDWVRHYFPELKCSWAYAVQGLNIAEGKVETINLKKKLFEQIITTAEDLGDPTDIDSGWDIVFKKAKTGPLAFNVEYSLQPLRCKARPLSDAERELVAGAKSIDEVFPRMTAEEQKAFIEKQILGQSESDDVPEGMGDGGESHDDIPY